MYSSVALFLYSSLAAANALFSKHQCSVPSPRGQVFGCVYETACIWHVGTHALKLGLSVFVILLL